MDQTALRVARALRRCAPLVLAIVTLAGCATPKYYLQSVSGHLDLLSRRVSVDGAIEDPSAAPALTERLRAMRAARAFASDELGLPRNRSYLDFVDVGRSHVVWNVVAVPALSLRPRVWCFLVVGCLSYRGYFDKAEAEAEGARWRDSGDDVYVGGVRAYSTLGWLPDPLLSTMLVGPRSYAAGVVFHELAHQVLYVKDDTRFNEAFAVAVEREGVARWMRASGNAAEVAVYRQSRERYDAVIALASQARADLQAIYQGDGSAPSKRLAKRARFARLRADYKRQRAAWGGYGGFDGWFLRGMNNARLALLATYTELVPAFDALLAHHEGDLRAFYDAAREIGALPKAERHRALAELKASRAARVPRS